MNNRFIYNKTQNFDRGLYTDIRTNFEVGLAITCTIIICALGVIGVVFSIPLLMIIGFGVTGFALLGTIILIAERERKRKYNRILSDHAERLISFLQKGYTLEVYQAEAIRLLLNETVPLNDPVNDRIITTLSFRNGFVDGRLMVSNLHQEQERTVI